MNSTVIEAIGYVGSVVVLISMLMTSVVRLRTINTIGSLVFTGYALMIHSYPTAALNFSLALINIYNLVKLYNNKKDYSVVKLRSDDAFVTYFLNLYKADIEKFFPAFVKPEECDCVYIVCRGTEAAGILLGKSGQNSSVNVKIDYATPVYRDCSVGKHLYKYLASQKIRELSIKNCSEKHISYLQDMGFVQNDDRFVKTLN